MGGFVRQNGEDWMSLHTRWSGLVCAACLALLIVIRYCCIEVLREVIVLPASDHQKVLASKKKKRASKLRILRKATNGLKPHKHMLNHA